MATQKRAEDGYTFTSEPRTIAARKKARLRPGPPPRALRSLRRAPLNCGFLAAAARARSRAVPPALPAEAHLVDPRQPKYREEAAPGGSPANIMYDRRIVRGNTYAAQAAPPVPPQVRPTVPPLATRPPRSSARLT